MPVEYARKAVKELAALHPSILDQIERALARLDVASHGDVCAIRGQPGEYRLRVGDYRVIFEREGNTVRVLRVAHRREVYGR